MRWALCMVVLVASVLALALGSGGTPARPTPLPVIHWHLFVPAGTPPSQEDPKPDIPL